MDPKTNENKEWYCYERMGAPVKSPHDPHLTVMELEDGQEILCPTIFGDYVLAKAERKGDGDFCAKSKDSFFVLHKEEDGWRCAMHGNLNAIVKLQLDGPHTARKGNMKWTPRRWRVG